MDQGEIVLQHWEGPGVPPGPQAPDFCPLGVAIHPERQLVKHGFKVLEGTPISSL